MKFQPHWSADIFPLNEADVDRLAEDIKANGQIQPIIVYQGQILDGRTRYAACKKAGVEPIVEEYMPKDGDVSDEEFVALSWSLNETRRHLSASQRACAAAEIVERMPVTPGRRPKSAINCSLTGLAGLYGSNKESVRQARELLRESPKLFAKVKAGELSVDAAYKVHTEALKHTSEASERASLANLRKVNGSLAEDVETGRKTMKEAIATADQEEREREERTSALGKIATGLFVSIAGLGITDEAMAKLKADATDIVQTRRDYQRKDDAPRYAMAIAILTAFQKANEKV